MSFRKRFQAFRVLDRKTVQDVAPSAWVEWRKTTDFYRGMGYRAGTQPPETGDLLVQSPYNDWYNLTWGLPPNSDMPKWRWMFRARPEIRRGIDLRTSLAVGRSFSVVVENDREVEDYITQLVNHLNMKDVLQSAVSDMLTYGQCYFEKIRAVSDEEQQESEVLEMSPIEKRASRDNVTREWNPKQFDVPDMYDYKGTINYVKNSQEWAKDAARVDSWVSENQTELHDAIDSQRVEFEANKSKKKRWRAGVYKRPPTGGLSMPQNRSSEQKRMAEFAPEEGELVELKTIDPMWMRVCRDAFGNVIGFVQWGLTAIPQSILSEKLVYMRWMPKSWAQENAYGTSILMPVQRHVSLLIQAEEDMKVWFHQYAKPMLVVMAGTPDKPYPVPMLQGLQNAFANRQSNTDAIVPGDVKVESLKTGMGDTTNAFKGWVKYLREKIYETLGIPSILMNLPDMTTRATSDVSLQAFVAEEEMIQELVGEQLLKQVLEPEVRRHFGDKYPDGAIPPIKIQWPSILSEDRNKKADRVGKAVGIPFMTVNEARTELGLPPLEDAQYDQIAPMGMPGLTSLPSKSPELSETQRTGAREEQSLKLSTGSDSNESEMATVNS